VSRVARALVVLLVAAATAHADAERCRTDVVKAAAKHAATVAKVLQKCGDRVLAGRLPPSTDCRADPALTTASAKLGAAVARACCGADGACGTGDDVPLGAIGWEIGACPDLESTGCDAPIASGADVAACLACIATTGAADVATLAAGHPAAAGVACRRVIAREAARLFRATSAALARCWEARSRGLHANPCPDPGDGVAGPAIARAEALATARMCAACGGEDGVCGGGDDVPVAALGAPARCPAVTVPGGATCDAPIATLADVVACVGCVGAFDAACRDRASVPAFAPYPATCNPAPGTCNTGVECASSVDCPAGYACRDNGGGTTSYCVGPTCAGDADCVGGAVCRPYCTTAGCGPPTCQCPGFGCAGPDQLCLDDGGLACRKLCTQDSDCTDPFGFVCVNPGFGFGVCIGQEPCQ
jgi:hypothetical protein